jgi:hypothetical protein
VEAFETAGVPYALAGGLAVSIYTEPRATEDIDVLVAYPDVERASAALEAIGFRRAGQPMRVAGGRLEIQRLTKIEGADLLPVDLLIPRDVDLSRTLSGRVEATVEGHPVSVVAVAGLRTLKRLRDSAQDRADLEALGPEA